jgi:hypothetical protein
MDEECSVRDSWYSGLVLIRFDYSISVSSGYEQGELTLLIYKVGETIYRPFYSYQL